MKTKILIGSAVLCKDCLFLVTGFGKKETEGKIFSEDVGKQGEWICFGKGADVEVFSEKVSPLNSSDKVVKLYLNGVFQGEVIPFYYPDKGIVEIMSIKRTIFGREGLRIAV